MQVDPDSQTFGEIRALSDEEVKAFLESEAKDTTVISDSEEKLKKLQEDLKRAGYKKS